jgi:hypothetical protein
MDFIEGLSKVRGKSIILTGVNRFSKYAHFIALSHPYSASLVSRAFFKASFVYTASPPPLLVIVIRSSPATCGVTSSRWLASSFA